MKKISNWYNRVHKIIQFKTTGGYDTFGTFRKNGNGKRMQHKRSRRELENERFYEGWEEFVEENRKKEGEKDGNVV